MIKKNTVLALLALTVLGSASRAVAADAWALADDKTNYLLAGDVCESIGLKEWTHGRKRFWVKEWNNPSQIFEWQVQGVQPGKCEVIALVNVPREGFELTLSSGSETIVLTATDKGWHRIYGEITISKKDTLKLALQEDLSGQEHAAEIIGLEIITEKYRPLYKQRIAEMRTPVEDAQWFLNSGFGIMFQWGNWGYPREGDRKSPWNKVYEDFDIEAFADKMKSFDPGYIFWSITWRGSRFSAPLKSVDQVMENSDYTMDYDFIGKLVDALTSRGIPVFFYYHPGAEEPGYWQKVWRGYDDVTFWEDANVAIWTEIGERLGDKLSGWFVDDGMVQYYPSDFYRYAKALKAGNPKRLITFNPWHAPNVSPFDDVSMGENRAPGNKVDGVFVDGPTRGMLAHSMNCMDVRGWGIFKKNSILKGPGRTAQWWQGVVDRSKQDKHPIAFCIGMYEDGSLHPKTEEILTTLKR
jgi:hypothetical protein